MKAKKPNPLQEFIKRSDAVKSEIKRVEAGLAEARAALPYMEKARQSLWIESQNNPGVPTAHYEEENERIIKHRRKIAVLEGRLADLWSEDTEVRRTLCRATNDEEAFKMVPSNDVRKIAELHRYEAIWDSRQPEIDNSYILEDRERMLSDPRLKKEIKAVKRYEALFEPETRFLRNHSLNYYVRYVDFVGYLSKADAFDRKRYDLATKLKMRWEELKLRDLDLL